MSDKSLHEELVNEFLSAAESPRETAAANEIKRLRRENAALERELEKVKPKEKSK